MLLRRSANLKRMRTIAHAFFGRTGGVSSGIYASLNCGSGSNDAADHIADNRNRAVRTLSGGAELVTLRQVHGARVVPVVTPWDIADAPDADGMVTNVPGIALGILSADCAPVLFADPEAGVIAAAHAGWKGALAGIASTTVARMEEFGAARHRIAAAIGPCISQASYEVGTEFRAAFVGRSSLYGRFFSSGARANRFQFNLEAFIADRLAELDLASVERLSLCTCARESEFFSFRRATKRGEPDYGRQLSAIQLCE